MKRRLAFAILLPLLLRRASADDLHDRFDKAVKELRSDDAAERDKGSAELEAIAKEAPEMVLPLAKDADPEVKGRAVEVLGRLHLLPETAAEKLFRKVEEKYAAAKTVQYRATLEEKQDEVLTRWTLEFVFKKPNLFTFAGTLARSDGKSFTIASACDGKRATYSLEGSGAINFPVGGNRDVLARAGIVRIGSWNGLRYLLSADSSPEKSENFSVEELRSPEDETVGEHLARVLVYGAKEDGQEGTWKQRIWIDREKGVVLKREATRGDGVTVTESYSDTKFDEEIPDEKFALPKEK